MAPREVCTGVSWLGGPVGVCPISNGLGTTKDENDEEGVET